MFYAGNSHLMGPHKQKRLIKIRTSAGDEDSQIKRLI